MLAPLAVGERRTVRLVVPDLGFGDAYFSISAEGRDLAGGDETADPEVRGPRPPLSLEVAARPQSIGNGIRVTVRSTRKGSVRLQVRRGSQTYTRTITLRRAGKRDVVLRPPRRLAREQGLVTLTARSGGATARARFAAFVLRARLSRLLLAAGHGRSDHDHRRNTMLAKVFYTSVLVTDQDQALDFYTNVLGLEKRVENPTPDGMRFLTVGVKGDDFQLVLWPGTPGQAQPAMGRPPASITIETDDIRKTFEELKSRGVEFATDVLEFPWGYVAQFQDPDGNRLQIREGR